MRFPGTLSARIIIGFAVLIVTFGGISVSAVLTTDQLNRTIRVIRIGYLQLALETRDLADRQQGLLSYLRDELVGESSPRRVETRLRRLRASRDRLFSQLNNTLSRLDEIPAGHQRRMQYTEDSLEEIRLLVRDADPLYELLEKAPPIERIADGSYPLPLEPRAVDDAQGAYRRLLRHESRVNVKTQSLQNFQRSMVQDTARQLERGSRKMRLLTILWGAIALFVGLLITIWATVNLRPLRRLRDAAREIARGDYGQRIDEGGPREVADLAREFNTMGQAIQERERELVRTERLAAVGKMAAMITHEVRNPLSSIGLNTELLEEELGQLDSEAEARSLCRSIQAEVDRLTDITEEYLQFARLPKPKFSDESVAAIVGNLVDFEREQLAQRGIAIEATIDEGLPRVMADDAQLRQALLNLLRNAAEALASTAGGTITITTSATAAGSVEVVVEDNGPGIDQETAAKIFDSFFSTKESGTGLGLALTHQIIRDHGGSIEVDGRPGVGARFIVTLPAGARSEPGQ